MQRFKVDLLFLLPPTCACTLHRYRSGHTGFPGDEEKKVYSRQEISTTAGGLLEDVRIGGTVSKRKMLLYGGTRKVRLFDRRELTLLCGLWPSAYKEGKPVLSKNKQNKTKHVKQK